MSKFRPIRAVLFSCAAASVLPTALAAQGTGIPLNPNFHVYCQYRVAATFPSAPMIRDIAYTIGGRTVPARQFYADRGQDRFSVTVADFTNVGPAIDEQIVENAAVPIRQRGEVKFQFPEDYSAGIPGRQLNVFDPNGRQHLASVYMADSRLYITETYAAPGDFAALQFEQSVLLIDGNGGDLNNAVVANRNRYPCETQPSVAEDAGDLVTQAIAAEGGTEALRGTDRARRQRQRPILGAGTVARAPAARPRSSGRRISRARGTLAKAWRAPIGTATSNIRRPRPS